jgi:hypothetical protein
MSSTLRRVAAVAAIGTVSILVPAAGASAASTALTPPAFALPTLPFTGLPAFNPAGLSFVGPSVGGLSAVIGPTVITVGAGNIFTDTTITTAGGTAVAGGP